MSGIHDLEGLEITLEVLSEDGARWTYSRVAQAGTVTLQRYDGQAGHIGVVAVLGDQRQPVRDRGRRDPGVIDRKAPSQLTQPRSQLGPGDRYPVVDR